MPTLSPYVQVAATRYLEDPSNLAFVRNTVAQQSEKRVNTIASLVSGGRVSGIGRVTQQALSQNNDELMAIQEQRSEVAKRAVESRAKAIDGYTGITKEQAGVVKAYIGQEATVRAANASASAVRDGNLMGSFKAQREASTTLMQALAKNGTMFGQIAEDEAAKTRLNDAFRSLQSMKLSGGAMTAADKKALLEKSFGNTSDLVGAELAVLRATALAGGLVTEQDLQAYPARDDERAAAAAVAETDQLLYKAYADASMSANAALTKFNSNKVGAGALSSQYSKGTDAQVESVKNQAHMLEILAGVDPDATGKLLNIIDQPLTPEDQAALDKLDEREKQIENQDRIMLLGDAKSMMRGDPTFRDKVKEVVVESTGKRAVAVQTDDSLTDEQKQAATQKVEASREDLLRKASTAHGRRLAAGVFREGRRAGRGALGAAVNDDGTITRDAERKITLPEGVERPTTGQEHRKVMQNVAGFGQGGAQRVFSRPTKEAPAAAAPAAEPAEQSASMDVEAPAAPAPPVEVSGIDRQRKAGVARRENLLSRLAAIRGDTGAA